MIKPVVCYKLHEPVIYNKGTKYEKSCDTFLECYSYSKEAAQEKCNELNETATDRVYFVSEQEEFY